MRRFSAFLLSRFEKRSYSQYLRTVAVGAGLGPRSRFENRAYNSTCEADQYAPFSANASQMLFSVAAISSL